MTDFPFAAKTRFCREQNHKKNLQSKLLSDLKGVDRKRYYILHKDRRKAWLGVSWSYDLDCKMIEFFVVPEIWNQTPGL